MKPEILISTPFEIFLASVLVIGFIVGCWILLYMIFKVSPEDNQDKRNLKIK